MCLGPRGGGEGGERATGRGKAVMRLAHLERQAIAGIP